MCSVERRINRLSYLCKVVLCTARASGPVQFGRVRLLLVSASTTTNCLFRGQLVTTLCTTVSVTPFAWIAQCVDLRGACVPASLSPTHSSCLCFGVTVDVTPPLGVGLT
jgi:hypothetical protein